jgi:hypothetical protein
VCACGMNVSGIFRYTRNGLCLDLEAMYWSKDVYGIVGILCMGYVETCDIWSLAGIIP